jgi:2'-5' RNA ligase
VEKEESLRLFIAVTLPENIRHELIAIQKKLIQTNLKIAWVPLENLHLTVVFLGDMPVSKVAQVKASMDEACAKLKVFSVPVKGVGTFGWSAHPRVVWAGFEHPSLGLLNARLVESLKKRDLPFDEKTFLPHISLGRIKDAGNVRDFMASISKLKEKSFGVVNIDDVVLFRGHHDSKGSSYEEIHRVALT